MARVFAPATLKFRYTWKKIITPHPRAAHFYRIGEFNAWNGLHELAVYGANTCSITLSFQKMVV